MFLKVVSYTVKVFTVMRQRFCYKFLAKSKGEGIVKIGQHMVKLWRNNIVGFFDLQCILNFAGSYGDEPYTVLQAGYTHESHKSVCIFQRVAELHAKSGLRVILRLPNPYTVTARWLRKCRSIMQPVMGN